MSFRPTAGSGEIETAVRVQPPVVVVCEAQGDPSRNKLRLFTLRKANNPLVSFRLEDGAAIWNGGIETADHSQSMDDVDKPGGFDPSTTTQLR
jgi:hypothetical protein